MTSADGRSAECVLLRALYDGAGRPRRRPKAPSWQVAVRVTVVHELVHVAS